MAEFRPQWSEEQVRTLTENYNSERTPENVKNIIAEHAQYYNLPFYEGDFEISEALMEAGKGFAEGFTANIVSFEPSNNQYEAIFRNLGHLAGFAPGIMSAPLGAASRLFPKAASLVTATHLARKLNKKSLPMMAANFATRHAKNIARPVLASASQGKSGATQTATNFLLGNQAKHIAEGAFHLGVASSVSSWRGGIDEMMSSFIHGGQAGAVFRTIGNYIGTGKGPGNKLARQVTGSLFMGLPETMRGATTPEQVYAYTMGAWFGGQERPWTYKKATDFIKEEFHPAYIGEGKNKGATEALKILPDPEILKKEWDKLPPEVKPIVKELIAKSYGTIDPDSPLAAAHHLMAELKKAGIKVDYESLSEGKGLEELQAIKEKIGTPKGQEPYFVITGGNEGAERLVSHITNKENVANIHMLTESQMKQYQERKHPGFPRPLKKIDLEEANEALREANETLKRGALSDLSPKKLDQLRKNYFIVKNADEVFLVGKVGGKRNNRVIPTASGTEWAHQMAINFKKPVYIYDQTSQRWMKWQKGVTGAFVPVSKMPKPSKAIAVVGDRFLRPETKDALNEYFGKHFKKTKLETEPVKEADKADTTKESQDGQTGMPGTDIPDAGDRASRIVTKYLTDLYKNIDIPALKASKMVKDMETIRDLLPNYVNRGLPENQSSGFIKKIEENFGIKFEDNLTGKEYVKFKDEMRQWIGRRNAEVETEYVDVNSTENTVNLMDRTAPRTMSGNRKPTFENRKIVDIIWKDIFGKDGRAYAIVDHISALTDKGWKDFTLSQFRTSARKQLGEKRYYKIMSKVLKDMSDKNDLYYFGGNGTADRLIMMKYHPEIDNIPDSFITNNFNNTTIKKLRSRFVEKFTDKNGFNKKEAEAYFDKAFKSNALWHLSTNGMELTWQNLKKSMKDGFIGNSVSWNKRSQIWFTDGFAADKEFYRSAEPNDGKLTDLSSEGNFKYKIIKDLPDKFAKLDHRDISLDSNQNPEFIDGSIIVRRDVLKLINQDSGNSSEGITQNKSFIVSPHKDRGALLGKYMMHDAGKAQSEAMAKEGIHYIIPESAAKQMGTRQFDKIYEDLSPEHIKHSYSVTSTEHMIEPQSAKKQLFGALISHLAKFSPKKMNKVLQEIYKDFIEPSFVGTTEAKAELSKFYKLPANASDKQVREALENIDFDNIGIEKMVEGLTKQGNQLFARKVYDLAFKQQRSELEEAIRDGEITAETYENEIAKIEDFHSLQQRVLRLGSRYADENGKPENMVGVYGHVAIADYRMQVMNNFIVKKATQPKISNSGNARIRPYDEYLQKNLDGTNERLKSLNKDDTLFFLDNTYKNMKINTDIPGIGKVPLGKLWEMYEGGKIKDKYKADVNEIFRSAVMRVPMDSVSGTQILKFSGFTGREGHGILMHSRAMKALGGADLDGDSAYFYMGGKRGFQKSWKDVYEANKGEFYKRRWINKKASGKHDRVDYFGVNNADWVDTSNRKLTHKKNSYYRGLLGDPIVDKNGNLILRGVKDNMFEEHFPGKGKGTSVTGDLTQAREHALIRLNYELKKLEEYMESFGAEESEIEAWQEMITERALPNLVRIDKVELDKLIKNYEKLEGQEASLEEVAGETRIVFKDEIVIPKGKWEKYSFKPDGKKIEDIMYEDGFQPLTNQKGEGVFGKVENTIVTANKAEKYESVLAKEWSEKDKKLINSIEGMFSPGVRMEISEGAVGGRNNLGMAAVNPKQIMASVYNTLVERGKDTFTIRQKVYDKKLKKSKFKKYDITIKPRTTQKEKDEINSLGRAMIGFASDPMDYAGLKTPAEWFNSLYNAHFKVTEVKVNGKKIQLRNFKIEDIPSYQWKDAGLYKLIHKANSAFYGRNWTNDRKWTMEERMSMTNELHTLKDNELNSMGPKISRMLSGLDYSDNTVKRISKEKIEKLYKLWKETPEDLKELLKPLGRTSFKVTAHKFISDVRDNELYTAEGLRKALNSNAIFNRIVKGTPYESKEWTTRYNAKHPAERWRAKLETLIEIRNKANDYIVNDLWNMLTNAEVRRIYEKMTPEERGENNAIIDAMSRSVDNIKKKSYLMARARGRFTPSKDIIRPKTKEEEIIMELWDNVPESEKPSFLQKQKTAYMDQNEIDLLIQSLKTNKYKTANQRALFDTLLLGSLNRGDLKRIDKLEKMITKKGNMTKLKFDVLSKMRTEAARTSLSRVGFSSKTVSDNSVMNMIGKYSDLFNESSTNRTEAELKKQGKTITVEPKKKENIEGTGMPEDVLSDLEAFLTRTTGLEGLKERGKKAYEKGLVDAETKKYISNIVSHLKLQNNKVAEELPKIVRSLVHKDMNVMNKQDWRFVSNWFDDVQAGTFWQRLKGGDFTKLSQRHYLQFPETINRELMKDELILMQEKGLFITKTGAKSGIVRRPTQYMDLIQESVQRTGGEAIALGEKYTNQLEQDLLFIQDLDGVQDLHNLAIRFREMPLGHKIRDRIQKKQSQENYFDADAYEKYYKEALKTTDYENSIKNKSFTITEIVDGKPTRVKRTGEEVINKINDVYTNFFKKMHNIMTGDVVRDSDFNPVTRIPESLSPYYSRYWDPKTQKSPRIDHVKFVRDMAKRWQDGKNLPLKFGIDGLHLVARSMMI